MCYINLGKTFVHKKLIAVCEVYISVVQRSL